MNAALTSPDDDPHAQPLPEADDGPGATGWPAVAEDAGDEDDAAAGPALRATAAAATEAQIAAWIEAIVERDERALAALYDATFSRVFGLVRRIVRSSALAEEVVEDAYFQVWRQAARFDPARGRALTWLLGMARSRAIDTLRREARFAHEALDDEGHPEPTCAQPEQDELLDLARQRADLHQALMLLGAQPRQLVSMSFLRGLSHEEIAEQMGLPLGTVKSQIRRALLALREALADPAARLLAS